MNYVYFISYNRFLNFICGLYLMLFLCRCSCEQVMFRATLVKVPPVRFGVRFVSRSSQEVDSIIRVDHAGELGADRIYAGQMAVLGMKL